MRVAMSWSVPHKRRELQVPRTSLIGNSPGVSGLYCIYS